MKETDLFLPVKYYLEHCMACEVHGEVDSIDVIGIGHTYEVLVELKTSLSLQLLDQIMKRKNYTDYIFVAIPKKRRLSPAAVSFLKSMNVGLIIVDLRAFERVKQDSLYDPANEEYMSFMVPTFVQIHHWGGRIRHPRKKFRNRVNENTKERIGGSTSKDVQTKYKITIENIKLYLRRQKRWVSIDTLLQQVETHYKHPKPSVIRTLQEEWNSDWVEVKKERRKTYVRYKGD